MSDRLSILLELLSPGLNQDNNSILFFFARINDLDLPTALSSPQILLDLPINYKGLKESAIRSGLHPIFICTCGYLICDSIYVDIVVNSQTVTWREYFRPDRSVEPKLKVSEFSYTFDREEYDRTIQSMEEAIKIYVNRFGKDKVLGPGDTRYADLLEQYAA